MRPLEERASERFPPLSLHLLRHPIFARQVDAEIHIGRKLLESHVQERDHVVRAVLAKQSVQRVLRLRLVDIHSTPAQHGALKAHLGLKRVVLDNPYRISDEAFDLADAEAVARGVSKVHGLTGVLCVRCASSARAARL